MNIGDLSHFTKVLTKRKCNYHDANVCLCQDSRICNDTNVSCSNDQGKAQLACGSSIKQVACMTRRSSHEKVDVAWQCISERLWKCLVGRYGGCFEERYKEAYDDRAYRAKGLDAPAKYAPTLEVRKGNARYRRG